MLSETDKKSAVANHLSPRTPHNYGLRIIAIVQAALGADPFCGAVYVFRSKRMDRVKLLWWDGTGICLMMNDLHSYYSSFLFS
jgi:transposase